MGLIQIQYEEGQTPLDEDEKDGLLIPSVTTRAELDEVEQRNIEEAIRWTLGRGKKFTASEMLTETFVRELHRRMLGEVWQWAGNFRQTDKNIGVDKYQVGIELRTLLDDCKYWIEKKVWGEDEIAIRFKHRIVSIHCFANGNGRHARLMGDLIAERSWGRKFSAGAARNRASTESPGRSTWPPCGKPIRAIISRL